MAISVKYVYSSNLYIKRYIHSRLIGTLGNVMTTLQYVQPIAIRTMCYYCTLYIDEK